MHELLSHLSIVNLQPHSNDEVIIFDGGAIGRFHDVLIGTKTGHAGLEPVSLWWHEVSHLSARIFQGLYSTANQSPHGLVVVVLQWSKDNHIIMITDKTKG